LFPKLVGNGNIKISFFHFNAWHYQREVTVFGQVSRQSDLLKAVQSLFCRFNQVKERTEGAIHHLQRLLCNIGIEKPVILIAFAVVVVRFVAQVSRFREKELSYRVKSYIVEVFTQMAQFPQRQKLLLAQVSNLTFLS
jgi:hypothetical protein